MLHAALLGGGWLVARGVAGLLGVSVSVLGILLAYAVVNVALTAWLLTRRLARELPEPPDPAVEALSAFGEEPLGTLIAENKDRLAKSRRAVGRQAAMYQPLDRLVRLSRKIERRLALEPDLRPAFSRALSQDLPLIAETAEHYVRLSRQDLPEEQSDRLIVAEGVLREAADRLDRLSDSDGKVDAAHIGLIRMDTNAELLAERMAANTGDAARRATAARVAHALRRAAKFVEEPLAEWLRAAADRVETEAVREGGITLNPSEASVIIEVAEAVCEDANSVAVEMLEKHVSALGKAG